MEGIGAALLLVGFAWWVEDKFFSPAARRERAWQRKLDKNVAIWNRLDSENPAEAERLRELSDRGEDYNDEAAREQFDREWRALGGQP